MILKSLTLHNFMSYADVQLDLSSINVACLSGQNGSGKSALLDAITWALWEQARSSSDELVRLSEKEMWVDLVFEYEGRTYRVRRSRQKRASKGGQKAMSKGTVDLQVLSPISGGEEPVASAPDVYATNSGTEEVSNFMSNAYGIVSQGVAPATGFRGGSSFAEVSVPGGAGIESTVFSGVGNFAQGETPSGGSVPSQSGAFSGSLAQSGTSSLGAVPLGEAGDVASWRSQPVLPAVAHDGSAIISHPSFHKKGTAEEEEEIAFGHWRSLTGANMRATQQVICNLLRMDYDTFINSAYLRQGRADEFTTRAPSERKQVLSEILGLSYFDQLQEACKLRARDSKTKIDLIESNLLNLPHVEESYRDVSAQLELERVRLKTTNEQFEAEEKLVHDLNEQVQALKLMQQKNEHASMQLREFKLDVENLERQMLDFEKRKGELKELIDRSSEIEEKANDYNRVKEELEEADRKAYQAQSFLQTRLELQSQLATMRSRFEVELEHLRVEIDQHEKKLIALRDDTAGGDKIRTAYDEFKALLKEESLLAEKQDSFTRLTQRANQLQTMVTEAQIKLEAEIGQKEVSLNEIDAVLAGEALLGEQKASLKNEVKELDRIESEFELVEQNGLMLKSEIEALEVKAEEIKRRQKEKREKAQELQEHKHTSICPLCSAPIVDRLAVINRYETEIAALEDEMFQLFKSRNELEDERTSMRNKYMQLKKELDGRKDLDKRIGQFNEKEEAIGRARETRDKLATELETLKKRLEHMDFAQVERESLVAVKAEIYKLEFDPATYTNLQSQIRAKRSIESRFHQLKKDQTELEKLENDLPDLLTKETKAHNELASEAYGEEIRSQIKAIKEQLDLMNYDRDRHQLLRNELEALLPFSEQVRDLKRALAELPALDKSLNDFDRMRLDKKKRIPEIEAEIETLSREILTLHSLEPQLQLAKEKLEAFRDQVNFLSREVAVFKSKKEQIEKELESLKSKKQQLEHLNEERDDFIFLADCFGKKGIQAVIIENAVPEIECEANKILGRLSENKMHVALVTQQKNKSGTVSETLDILIGDEIGTRNYELYSGGEAFKINFAIRIALSRLLARRAGARLETLIIDEGFGSQDEVSRDRLAKAIKLIQPYFQKILVITHISDVREMFPVQIHVTKQSGVSRLQVI